MGQQDRTRVVGYQISGQVNETQAERVLAKAKADGTVTEYDAGRGACVWFNGHPGAALRAVRNALWALRTP